MTINLLDLYNETASQEWAMYDNDAESQSEMENSLIIALNKSITEILYSYPFGFREKTHIIFTVPKINSYDAPKGLIMKDNLDSVKINSLKLQKTDIIPNNKVYGTPEIYTIRRNKIILYPIPLEKNILTVDYVTSAIGEDSNGNEIYALKNSTDILYVPEYLEELFKNAVISRTMLNSISSLNDENYAAYKKQSEIAYRMLVKYSKGMQTEKTVKI